MSKLIIAEKPSVAKSIASALGASSRADGFYEGSGLIVSWCVGHLVSPLDAGGYDERFKKWRYEDLPLLPEPFRYAPIPGKEAALDNVKRLMAREDVTEIVNACDAGREGELIFRLVYEMAGCRKPVLRLWISSMEDSAIREGFSELRPGAEYEALYQSALCRQRADWLVGINATRLFSVLYHRTLNVGRVQTPTLAMLVDRDSKITLFRKEKYHHVRLTFGGAEAVSEKITAPEEAESGLRGFYAQPDGSARIMVLHGDVGSREGRYRPIAPEEIASTGLDYLALGHVHAPSAMNRAGSTVWAYPGCPQGRGFDETGDRGFLFGDVEPGRVDMQFVPFARRRYEILTVDVSQGDALEAIRRRLPPDTSRDIYRIRLTGETAEPLTLPALEQALSGGFFQLELADDTRLRRDLWDRCGDDTLRGLFLRRLRREYDAADPRRQKEIEQAVRFGLAAMDNKEL